MDCSPPGSSVHGSPQARILEWVAISRQEYRSGLPSPSPADLPHPGIEHGSPEFQADSLLSEPRGHGVFQLYIEVSFRFCLLLAR